MTGGSRWSQHAGAEPGSFDVARVLEGSALPIVNALGPEQAELPDALLRAAVQRALGDVRWPSRDYRVRADRAPGSDGAWRFDLLIERSDSVLAALEIRSGDDDLERQSLALSHLSLALGRGIAERAFLIAVARQGTGPTGAALAASDPGPTADGRGSPLLIARVPLAGGVSQKDLTVLEARRSGA